MNFLLLPFDIPNVHFEDDRRPSFSAMSHERNQEIHLHCLNLTINSLLKRVQPLLMKLCIFKAAVKTVTFAVPEDNVLCFVEEETQNLSFYHSESNGNYPPTSSVITVSIEQVRTQFATYSFHYKFDKRSTDTINLCDYGSIFPDCSTFEMLP